MKVAIVKYNAGNIQSLKFALLRLGVAPVVTDDPELLSSADKVIFPGQGEASSAMQYLKHRKLDQVLSALQQPFLGICLGMQLMCKHSEENDTDCLGIIDARVSKFRGNIKVPHMGWNSTYELIGPLMKGIREGDYFYFVHSYFVEANDLSVAKCNYGTPFSAAVQFKNFYAIQPHPEKSAEAGHQVLKNFLAI